MRSDYSLYIVAIICFIIAGVLLSDATGLQPNMSQVAMAISVILGILFAAGGYTLRPKVVARAPEVPSPRIAEPSPPATPPPQAPTEEPAPTAPTPPPPAPPPPAEEAPIPAPTVEEPAKVEETAEKPTRRRRRKKTA